MKFYLNEMSAVETRLIKSTSKRQITIPKSFFDILSLNQGESFIAQLFDDLIVLIPQSKSQDSVRDEDRKEIIRRVAREGYTGEALVEELTFRLQEYDRFIMKRIKEFDADISEDETALGDTLGVTDFNGLEVFFDSENETPAKETGS